MLKESREQGDGVSLLVSGTCACLPSGSLNCQEFICLGPEAAPEREPCEREEWSGDEERIHCGRCVQRAHYLASSLTQPLKELSVRSV